MANEGKASVEIVGDVRNFARQTEKDLNEALRKIKPNPIDVPIDADQLKTEADKAGEVLADGITRGADGRLRDARGKFVKMGTVTGAAIGDGIAQESVKRLRDAKGRFIKESEDIGDETGRSFVRRFGSTLGKGLKGTSSLLGKALSGVADLLTKSVRGVSSVVSGVFTTIMETGGKAFKFLFATLAGLLIQASPAIGAAITAAVGIGLGAAFIGLGALALRESKPLQNAWKGTLKTLNEVARRAAQPLLRPLVKSAEIFSETIKGLEKPFRSIFASMAKQVEPLAKNFGSFIKNFVGGLKDSMPGINAAFGAFSDTLPKIGKQLGDFFKIIFANDKLIDNATRGVLDLIFGALKPLASVLSGLTVVFAAVGNLMKLWSGTFLPRIIEGIRQFVDSGSGMLGRITDAWGPLGDAIQNVWNKIKEFAAEDNDKKLEEKFVAVVAAIKEAWGPLKNFLQVLWNEIVDLIRRKWEEDFIPWWDGTAKPWLQAAVESAFRTAWNAAVRIVGEKLSQLTNQAQAWLGALPGRIGGWLASIPGRIATVFSSAAARALAAIMRFVSTAAAGFRQLVSRIGSALSGVRNAVVGAFNGAAGWLRSAGANIINGLLSGIRAGFGRVRSLLGELTSMLPSWKGPAEVDRKILHKSGKLVMQGFEAGILDSKRSIAKTLGGVTGDLASWAAPTGQRGYGAATTVSGGLTFNINVSGATGEAAGQRAAEQVLKQLAAAGLVR